MTQLRQNRDNIQWGPANFMVGPPEYRHSPPKDRNHFRYFGHRTCDSTGALRPEQKDHAPP